MKEVKLMVGKKTVADQARENLAKEDKAKIKADKVLGKAGPKAKKG